MLELLDKNMERVTITAFHIFKRLEKMFSTLNRDTKGTNKKIKLLAKILAVVFQEEVLFGENNYLILDLV